MVITSVKIREDQMKWIRETKIPASRIVRDLLDKEMAKEKKRD